MALPSLGSTLSSSEAICTTMVGWETEQRLMQALTEIVRMLMSSPHQLVPVLSTKVATLLLSSSYCSAPSNESAFPPYLINALQVIPSHAQLHRQQPVTSPADQAVLVPV